MSSDIGYQKGLRLKHATRMTVDKSPGGRLWLLPLTLLHPLLLLLLLTPSVTCTQPGTVNPYLAETFSDSQNNGNINHVTVDQTSGKVYIGAVNRLYQLSELLAVERTVATGPQDDSPNCPADGECVCDAATNCEKTPTDSINKAMLIDYENDRIIACTNVFQGHCEKRHLGEINKMDDHLFRPMVPMDGVSPAVLFIAPGPTPSPGDRHNVLYVGATRSLNGMTVYRDLIPAISSRKLDSWDLVYADIGSKTQKDIEVQHRDTFRILFKYGFSSDGFSYFLTVQKTSVDTGNIDYRTQMVRVCQNDEKYYSYTEIPIQCHVGDVNYNILMAAYVTRAGADLARSLGLSHIPPFSEKEDVLFAVFSRSEPYSSTPVAESALCVYPMREVREKFTKTIQDCFNGVGNTGPTHMVVPQACTRTTINIQDDYCGEHDTNQPIAGDSPIAAEGAFDFPGALLTSLLVTRIHSFTVAFIGTHDGRLKKVVIESKTSAVEYDDFAVQEGSRVNPDMFMDRGEDHVYVTTEKQVTRVLVEKCSLHTTCSACLGAGDPYCGWCSLDNKCSKRSDCQNADDPLRWLPYTAQCTKIVQVLPEQVQIQRTQTKGTLLTLTIQNLPTPTNGEYQCAFEGYGYLPVRTTTATRIGGTDPDSGASVHANHTLTCETPMPNLLPQIPTGQDHIVMKLSIRMNNKDFVSTNFTFFDCSRHTSCTDCTKSDYPCTWCVRGHKCTHNRETCLADTLVTGKNVKGATDRPGPEKCPRIENRFTQILVPSFTEKNVRVKAINLQDFQDDFKCEFSVVDGARIVDAKKKFDDTIQCEKVIFEYSSSTPYLNVPFKILWGNPPRKLDNPDNIQVKVYKCEAMGDNCGSCLTINATYECGWCGTKCTIRDECPAAATGALRWLDNTQICPNPSITAFSPITGPVKGGTIVTILGENLGKIYDDIKDGVTVADVPCAPLQRSYEPARKIVCETGASASSGSSGAVEVVVNNKYRGQSATKFRYVKPRIVDFKPKIGPKAGGTRLTVWGEHMNAGTTITATVAGESCAIIDNHVFEDHVICITPPDTKPSSGASSGPVRMQFDRESVKFSAEHFEYVHNPSVEHVVNEKSIVSGGTHLTVRGSNLDAIQDPKIVVYIGNEQFIGPCVVLDEKHMNCTAPSLKTSHLDSLTIKPESPVILPYGFLMDNVLDLRNITAHSSESRLFLVYPDPTFEEFEDGVKKFQSKNEYLTINGENLNWAITESDVHVFIGEQECKVTSIAQFQLNCQPPADIDLVGDAMVMVYVGRNLTFTVGELKYEGAGVTTVLGMFTQPVVFGIAGAGLFLVLLIITILLLYCHKSRESRRVKRSLQNQMDLLEAKVAKECKEAFAELQTDMTELTSDLAGSQGIPFRDYRSFTMRVLFPTENEHDHPVTRHTEVDLVRPENHYRGLQEFDKLLHNKTFLLLFIRCLEKQPDFSMRERCKVASLISVALQNRMDYHAEILKILLEELIEKSVEGRNHPKLLLRRTESVAEKMLTNWFTFLLYKFLKECAGSPLFMLYRAIKQQVDKGPVDAIRGEAKYSLSEDKLIRQQIDYRTLTLHIENPVPLIPLPTVHALDPELQFAQQDHAVKVLDCDTVTQVKEKILDAIYKNQRYSDRPDKDSLDLEWRRQPHAKDVLLQDEDGSNRTEGDHKKINTLVHYKVQDGAVMALVPRQRANNSMFDLSLRSNSHHRFGDMYSSYANSPSSLPRSVSPRDMSITMDVERNGNGHSSKVYHIVKPSEVSDAHRGEGDRTSKMVSEIYLTRLLATKGTLQTFVDDLFETIFSTTNRSQCLPLAIKYMFDFLDDQALFHGITDPEVVHTWKSNSLPLRFWVNVVKNPDFVFDVHKSNIVDACLSVVAQTFMDSCATSKHELSKDSPSGKLLYAKDIPKYKKWVERYYKDIKEMPAISDQDMAAMLAEESRAHAHEFNLNATVRELYRYTVKYHQPLMESLQEDEFAETHKLTRRLTIVHQMMVNEC